jgi:hypothetical protein
MMIPDWCLPVAAMVMVVLMAIGVFLLLALVVAVEAAAEALGTMADVFDHRRLPGAAESEPPTEAELDQTMGWLPKSAALTATCFRCGSMMSLCRCKPVS